MNVPDFIPVLSHGSHYDPASGACFMEMISFLAGEEHSDRPRCVNETLVGLGITVNDFVSDDNRNRLALLIPDFMGTSDIDMNILRARAQQEVLPEFYNWYLDKNEFQHHAISKKFQMAWPVLAIMDNYRENQTRLSNFEYDDAALSYIEKVAAIIRDMKEPEPVDLSKAKEAPSQVKANA